MADKSKTVIIKRVRKGHAAAHGGSWKVAYADFVTAMMAFFLLLWLLSMSSSEKRAVLAQYFKHFSVFSESGVSFLKESSQILEHSGGEVKSLSKEAGMGSEITAPDLREKLKHDIEEKLKDLKDQAILDIVDGGVRIQIVDAEGKQMFLPGSAELSPSAKALLKLISDNIKDMTGRIAIEGHTDGTPLRKGQVTNWELSTERALSARKELEKNSISSDRIARVVGYADTDLLVREDPTDTRNRRISIILLPPKIKETEKLSLEKPIQPRQEAPRPEPSRALELPVPAAPTPAPGIEKKVDKGVIRSPEKETARGTAGSAPPLPRQEKGAPSIRPEFGIKPQKPIDIFKK